MPCIILGDDFNTPNISTHCNIIFSFAHNAAYISGICTVCSSTSSSSLTAFFSSSSSEEPQINKSSTDSSSESEHNIELSVGSLLVLFLSAVLARNTCSCTSLLDFHKNS
eukprot:156507_1